jgi:hypothetical protein
VSGLRRSRHAVCLITLDHQLAWASAFAEGLRRHGWSVVIREDYEPCDLLVKWGVRDQKVIQIQRKSGGEICILERGYLGDRFQWTSVSFGGELNGRAEFRGVRSEPERFSRYFADLMQPWDRKPGYALLIGQVPGDMSIAHTNIVAWYRASAERLKQKGWQVKFRAHPVALQRGIAYAPPAGVAPIGGSLTAALAGAGVVVTFSSNAAVEAVLSGVPTVACDPGSMARAVASHRVDDALIAPDRSRWANALAWKQWSAEEIASGDCWAAVSAKSLVAS